MEGTKVTNSQDQDNSLFVVPVVTLGLLNLFALTASASKAELCSPAHFYSPKDILLEITRNIFNVVFIHRSLSLDCKVLERRWFLTHHNRLSLELVSSSHSITVL